MLFRSHALAVASESLNLQQISYTAGKTTVLQLIDAERTFAQAKLTLVTAEIQQYEDTADLLVALGGGWWNDKIESDRAALGRVAVAPANATPLAQP